MRSELADRLRELVGQVPDPEIPVLTIADLGVLRRVEVSDDGRVEVEITPTYSGCPAMDMIRADIVDRLAAAGHPDAEVRVVLSPAWTTDWMTEEGKRKLREYGIAPPWTGRPCHGAALGQVPPVRLARHPRGESLRIHRLQGPLHLRLLPGAVRPLQGDLTAVRSRSVWRPPRPDPGRLDGVEREPSRVSDRAGSRRI